MTEKNVHEHLSKQLIRNFHGQNILFLAITLILYMLSQSTKMSIYILRK